MVLEELLPMLSSMGMDTIRVGFLAWSMGGYRTLLLGARLGPSRTAGICATTPVLFTSFTDSTPARLIATTIGCQTAWSICRRCRQFPCRWTCDTNDSFYLAPVNSSTS